MKQFLSILLVILLFGCQRSPGHTVNEIGSTVKNCCAYFCTSPKAMVIVNTTADIESRSNTESFSVLEPNALMVHTW